MEHSSRLVAATSWGAILIGVFVALALQTVLLLLGLAIAGSVGDHVASTGFGVWSVLVAIVSFVIGGALAGAPRDAVGADHRGRGIAAGFLMWAVALVAGNFLSGFLVGTSRFGVERDLSLWTPLIGALLALGAAVIGGVIGASLRGARMSSTRLDAPLAR